MIIIIVCCILLLIILLTASHNTTPTPQVNNSCPTGQYYSSSGCIDLLANGVTCSTGNECTSGICSNVCVACLPTSCPSGQYCSSSGCTDLLANGVTCSTGNECTSGICSDVCVACLPTSCSSGQYCSSSGCTDLLANGAKCDSDNQCISKLCDSSGLCAPCDGQSCSSSQYCSANGCVDLLANGTACTSNAQCEVGLCNASGFCGTSDFGSCSVSSDCQSNYCGTDLKCHQKCTATTEYCTDSNTTCTSEGICATTVGPGNSCDGTYIVCTSGTRCISGSCSFGAPQGSSCGQDSDCSNQPGAATLYCLNEHCQTSTAVNGMPCDNPWNCQSTYCVGGYCSAQNCAQSNAHCRVQSDCCDSTQTCTNGLCTPAVSAPGFGEPCTINTGCAPTFLCTESEPNNFTCLNQSFVQSGVLNTANGIVHTCPNSSAAYYDTNVNNCAPIRELGAKCLADADCGPNICDSGICRRNNLLYGDCTSDNCTCPTQDSTCNACNAVNQCVPYYGISQPPHCMTGYKAGPNNLCVLDTSYVPPCNATSGPFCKVGYYCNSDNECVVNDGINCDLGGGACPLNNVCDKLSLTCVAASLAETSNGAMYSYGTSANMGDLCNSPASTQFGNLGDALEYCIGNPCAGIFKGNNGTSDEYYVLTSIAPVDSVTVCNLYPTVSA